MRKIAAPSLKRHSQSGSTDNPIIADMTLEKALAFSLWLCNFFKVLQVYRTLHDQNDKGQPVSYIYLRLAVKTLFLQETCAIVKEMKRTLGSQQS
jgi:hypothetical protein